VRHVAAPKDDEAGFQLFLVGDERHGSNPRCAETVQIGGVSP
jgi:hypothetical protein